MLLSDRVYTKSNLPYRVANFRATGYNELHVIYTDEILIVARILTICDVFDVLTVDDRPYKKAKIKLWAD